MHKVNLNGKEIFVCDGEILSHIIMKHGFHTEHPCGGNGKCGKCTVIVDGTEELSCKYKVKKDISVSFLNKGGIFSFSGADTNGVLSDNMCFALDIGSTTIALALVSLDTGNIIDVKTCDNPQKVFGADVIARIDYCMKNGITQLCNVLRSAVNSLIAEFEVNSIKKLYVSGNTTMLHTFFGVDCSSMGKAPYVPVFLKSMTKKASVLGINGVETVISLPSVAAFVGADIVAGLNLVRGQEKGKYSFLIDLGTNAEIALFSSDSVLCTSAAAGPCFEGGNISCGMGATSGAVYAYSENEVKTIFDSEPKGVCGTGLIDIISYLMDTEKIDGSGFMENESFEIAPGVTISQNDVRQYQLAKSAVYSAVITLMRIKKIGFESIDKVYISGGFSAKINIENAIHSGLLPAEFNGKCVVLNNSSLLGTVKFVVEDNDIFAILDNAEYIDLSSNSDFTELFVDNMMFF